MSDDINYRAERLRADAERARATEIAQQREAAAKARATAEAKKRDGAEIKRLAEQLARWAKANGVSPGIWFGFHRGWIVANSMSENGDMYYHHYLGVSTGGNLYRLEHGQAIIFSNRWTGSRVWDLSYIGYTPEEVKNGIAEIVAKSGKSW